MHIMLSTFAYIPLASDLIVVGGGGWVVEGLVWDKSTSARLCAKNERVAYARGGAYLWDTTVLVNS